MKIGETINVKLLDNDLKDQNSKILQVVVPETNVRGMLKIKGELKIRKDGTIRAWLLEHDKTRDQYIFGNSYFGKFTISANIAKSYTDALSRLYSSEVKNVLPEDISLLKGMVNRCLRHDQWDWYTTYECLGFPSYHLENAFVRECVELRKKIINNDYSSIEDFRARYHYMLNSMLAHLNACPAFNDDSIDTPIEGFDENLWQMLLYDSKRNIKIVEGTYSQISKYMLMHYFVTLEQEFYSNFIEPFVESQSTICFICKNEKLKLCHDILTGHSHFSLGSIMYLGRFCEDQQAQLDSEAIRAFTVYLGEDKKTFINLCEDITCKKICGVPLKDLRNGLAHGDSSVIARISPNAFSELHSYLFGSPSYLLRQILIHSKKNICLYSSCSAQRL